MAGVSAGRFGPLGRAASFTRRQSDIEICGCLTMPAALPSSTETKNRPAAKRAARSVVFPSIHPACSDVNSLRSKVGVAAKLAAAEGDRDAPRFRRWKALHFREGSPPARKRLPLLVAVPANAETLP